jgi:transposase
MGRASKYPDELRGRAVRMGMLGIGTPETLRTWIRRSEVDAGLKPGVTSQMARRTRRCAGRSPSYARIPRRLHPRGRRKTPLRSQTHPTESGVIQHNQSPDLPGRLNPPWNCCAAFGCR